MAPEVAQTDGHAPPAGAPRTVGVVGAGTMGRGIAQLACASGARTIVHDVVPGAAAQAIERIRAELSKLVARGRLSEAAAEAAVGRLEAGELGDLSACELVIEAAPEDLALKQGLFERLSREIVGPGCVLASNTSTLSVTAIAARAEGPERVVGMHFFNPAPVLPLVEIVAGAATGARAVAAATAAAAAFGKRAVRAPDAPGFIANRCQNPYFLEALRVVEEGIATVEQVDRICRGAGFPMGPFELMDLIGLDVLAPGLRHLFEQSDGEPRWRPSPLLERTALAGRTGRKAGRGFYDYGADRASDTAGVPAPRPPAAPDGQGRPVQIGGESALAASLRTLASAAGWRVLADGDDPDAPVFLRVQADGAALAAADVPTALSCAGGSLARLDPAGAAAGFVAPPPLARATLTELARGPRTAPETAAAVESFFRSLNREVEWVRDSPGLVSARIVAQLMNEASFVVDFGLASADDVDLAMTLGYGYPLGPLAWLEAAGPAWPLAVLDGLAAEYGEERYRAAPGLRRRAWLSASPTP